MQPSVDQTVVELADWTEDERAGEAAEAEAPATAERTGNQCVRINHRAPRTQRTVLISSVNSVSSVVNPSER